MNGFYCFYFQYHLARSLNLSTFRNRLMQDALLLHNIDLAMHRENLSSLELADAQQVWSGNENFLWCAVKNNFFWEKFYC